MLGLQQPAQNAWPFCLAAAVATDDDDVSVEAEGSEGSGKTDSDEESPATTKGAKKGAPGRMVRCHAAHSTILWRKQGLLEGALQATKWTAYLLLDVSFGTEKQA